jgi:hypothetical protein
MSSLVLKAVQDRNIDDVMGGMDSQTGTTLGYSPFAILRFDTIASMSNCTNSLQHIDSSPTSIITTSQGSHRDIIVTPRESDQQDDVFEAIWPVEDLSTSDTTSTALIKSSTSNDLVVDWSWPTDAYLGSDDHMTGFDGYSISSPTLLWNLTLYHEQRVPQQATFLLDHYRQQMVKLFSPKGSQKPPWAILHLPNALSTLSELTTSGTASHARLSLFFSLLAVSSFNLDRLYLDVPGVSDFWWALGDEFRNFAKQEVKKSIAAEFTGPKLSKYKDVLMALLTMVTISVSLNRYRVVLTSFSLHDQRL